MVNLWTSGLTFDIANYNSSQFCLKLCIVLTHTLSVNRLECLTPLIAHKAHTHTHKNTRDTDWRWDNEYQVEMRWRSKRRSFFPFSFHPQNPSNPPSTSKPWSSDSSNHNPLKMSLSSENGSTQKSIKGFNVVGLPWLPRLLSVIHQITQAHSILLVSARPQTGREHYV